MEWDYVCRMSAKWIQFYENIRRNCCSQFSLFQMVFYRNVSAGVYGCLNCVLYSLLFHYPRLFYVFLFVLTRVLSFRLVLFIFNCNLNLLCTWMLAAHKKRENLVVISPGNSQKKWIQETAWMWIKTDFGNCVQVHIQRQNRTRCLVFTFSLFARIFPLVT